MLKLDIYDGHTHPKAVNTLHNTFVRNQAYNSFIIYLAQSVYIVLYREHRTGQVTAPRSLQRETKEVGMGMRGKYAISQWVVSPHILFGRHHNGNPPL